MNKKSNINKLNINSEFKQKLENLYKKNTVTNEKPEKNKIQFNSNDKTNIKKTLQPQKNVVLTNNLEEVYEINKEKSKQINSSNIIITIQINSYYELFCYILFSVFSICLSLRIAYILFLL